MKRNHISLSVAIPVYNEEESIRQVVRDASIAVSKMTSDYEIVLVDDGSTDKTREIIDELQKRDAHIIVVHHFKNKGFTGALLSASRNAQKEYIFIGPGDGQFDYGELPVFVRAIRNNDIVVSYRPYNEERIIRKILSTLYHALIHNFFGLKVRELSTCILFRKTVRDDISISSDPYSSLFLLEFVYKAIRLGYRIGEVPIHFYRRKSGQEKGTNPRMIIKTLWAMIRFWKQKGRILRSGTIIYSGVRIGDNFQSGHYTLIREGNRIGNNVRVGSFTELALQNTIGDNTRIHSRCFLEDVTLGRNVFIGPGVVFANDPHPRSPKGSACIKGATVEDDAVIGAGATILPHVVIGKGALVGAGSVVTKDVPPGSVVIGNPARKIKNIRDIVCRKLKKPHHPYGTKN